MQKSKKLISIVLITAFLFTTIDFGVFANEVSEQTEENEVVQELSLLSQAQPAPSNNISGETKLTGNITIEPNSNMYYSGNVVLEGNLTIRQGARLEIKGNLTIVNNGSLTISDDSVVLIIMGGLSFLSNRQSNMSGNCIIEVYKDIVQEGSTNNAHFGGNSTVILKGDTQQTINFKNPRECKIYNLINENISGKPLVFRNSLNFDKYFDNGQGITGFVGNERAVTIDNGLRFFRYSGEKAWMNKELIIHGNLYIKESVDVNITETETDRVTLRVKGDYIQEKGNFKTYGQRMIVEGNFVQNSGEFTVMGNETLLEVKGNMDIAGNSVFKMHYIGSRVIVDGNFTMRSTRSHAGEIKAGTMEIKGDFIQDCDQYVADNPGSTWGGLASQALNFCVIDKNEELQEKDIYQHRVVLNGEGKQTVTFKTATRIKNDKSLELRMSQFSILVITKPFNTYNFTNDLSRERIYEKLEDLSFDKNNNNPYKLKRNLDVPKSRLGLVNSNGNIYAIGGANGSIIYDTVQRYEPEEDRWYNVGSLNERRMELAATVANNDIYVFGGFNGYEIVDSVERITSGGLIETIELESGYIIPKRGHQAIYHNDKIYLIGGQDADGNILNSLEVFDVSDRTVKPLNGMEIARKDFGAALALVGDKFYIVVAGGDNGTTAMSEVEMYDIKENKWIGAGYLKTERKGLGLQFVLGKLFAFGGLSNNGQYLDTVEVFDDNKTWSILDKNIYTKRGYFGSTVGFNSIFIAGGEKPEVLNIFEQFMPVAIPGVRFKGRTRGLNGDFTQEETDLVFNSSPMSFDLRRSYNTQFKEEAGDFLGYGWQFNLESSLKVMNENAGTITASYLNVREKPWGRIVGGLEKGTIVPFDRSESVVDPYDSNRMWHKILGKYYIAAWYVENLSGSGVEVKYPSGIKGYFTEGKKSSDKVEFKANFGTYEKLYLDVKTGAYELITKEQTKYIYTYDSSDKIYRNTKTIDRYGNTVDISYTNSNGAKRLTALSNSGRKITLERTAQVNGKSKVTAIDGDNRKIEYTIQDNKLEKVSNTLGLETIYAYNSDNSISKIEKDGKTFAQITYDDSGRIETYTDAMDNKSHNYYEDVYMDESGDSLKIAGSLKRCVTDPKGYETITTYNLVEKKPVLVVDGEKGITKYKYEIFYNDKYFDITNLKDTDKFYKDHYLENIMKGQWKTRETVTDINGQITVTDKDERGNVREITKPDKSTLMYVYDELNNLVRETNNAGGHIVVNEYIYEALNRQDKVYLKNVSILDGSKNHNIIYDYYLNKNIYGLVKSKSTLRDDSNNKRILEEYDYSSKGELIKEKIGDRTTYIGHRYGSFTTSVDCDVNGRKISIEAPKNSYERGIFYVSAMIKPSGNIGIVQYDSMLNPVKTTLKSVDETKESTSLIVYDKQGRKVREVSPEIYAKSPSVAHNLNRECHLYDYYENGLVKEHQDPENNITKYIYDKNGNLEREINPAKAEYIYEYDGVGRLTRSKFKDPQYGNDEIILEESFYERGENIKKDSDREKASKKTHVKYIDGDTSLRTDTYFDYAGREIIIENPYGKVEKEYYGDGSLKKESVFNKRLQYGASFYDLISNNTYFYNKKGLLDIIVRAHTVENHSWKYFITKYGYTDDGLTDYEITWLDAELLSLENGVKLPENKKANVTRYEYDDIGNVTSELSYIGNITFLKPGQPSFLGLDFVKKSEMKYDADGNLNREIRGNEETIFSHNYLSKPSEMRSIVKRDEVFIESIDNVENVEGDTSLLALVTKYDYDKDGNVRIHTSPSKSIVEYKYDTMGRIKDTLYHGVKDEYGKSLTYLKESNDYDWKGNVVRSESKAIYPTGEEKIHSQSEYHYDGKGQLLVSIDKLDENGINRDVVHSYAYNNGGNLIAEANPESFSHLGASNQSDIKKYSVDNAASKINYTYDLMGRLKTKEFSGKTYEYNPYIREMEQKDEKFVVKAYAYDSNDNIVKEVDGKEFKIASAKSKNVDEIIKNANGTVFTYTLSNNLATVTYPKDVSEGKGISVSYDYDALGNVVKEKKSMGTSGTGSMVEYVSLTSTTYAQNSDGTITYTSTTGIENPSPNNTYAQGSIKKVWKTDVNGNVVEESVGKNKISKEYNGLGLERKSIKEVDSYLENGKEVVVNSEMLTFYDVDGNMKIVKNSSDTFEINKYDVLGRLTSKTIGKKNSASKDNQTLESDLSRSVITRWDYDVNGNVRFEYDGNDFKTEYIYDGLNRLKNTVKRYHEEKDPSKREILSEVLRDYDLDSNLIEEKNRLTDKNNNKRIVTRQEAFRYDGLGRLVEKAEIEGSIKVPYESIEYNENSDQRFSYDAEGKRTEYIYDLNRNHIDTIDPVGNLSKQSYGRCGNIISKTDGEKNNTLYYYDVLDRLTKVTYLKNGLNEVEISSYSYNEEGNIKEQKSGSKNTVTFEYTASNSIKKRTTGGKTDTFFYNSDGSLLKTVDNKKNETIYEYTPQGLVEKEEVREGGEVVIIKDYKYDNNGNPIEATLKTKDRQNRISRRYDHLGRVYRKVATDSITANFKYDIITDEGLIGEVSSYENGKSTSKVYDIMGRLKYVYSVDITDARISATEKNSAKTEYKYDIKGRRESILYPNSSKADYKYYDNNNLRILTNYVNGVEIEKYEYEYYKNNTMKFKKESYEGELRGTTNYEYDELLRLKSTVERRGGNLYRKVDYTYDDSGNREKETTQLNGQVTIKDYKYKEGNVLEGYTVTVDGRMQDELQYIYDANGNLTHEYIIFENGLNLRGKEKVKTHNEYNGLNQLVKTTTDKFVVENQYNVEGLRTSKEVKRISDNGSIELVDKNNYTYEYEKVIFETSTKTNDLVWNVYGINLISRFVEGEMLYCLYNGHADITRLVNKEGELVEKYYYDEWGVETESIKYGDLNGDKRIDSTDYVLIRRILLEIIKNPSDEIMIAADLNADGRLNSTDAVILRRMLLEILKHCPADTNQDGFVNEKSNIKYKGYFYDGETGLYYLNARFYDPETARFIQQDTYRGDIHDPLSLNLYTYGHNNPIKYYDPTGHFVNLISGAIGAGAGFIIGAGASMISDALKGELKRDNWRKYVGAGAQGAIIGGVAGLTAGLGLGVVATVGIGVGAGAAGNTANQVIRNKGFNDFSVKELAVSSIASGAGFGAGKLISSTASNLTSNISSQALQQTAQGAIVGGTAGASGSFTANVTSQTWDIARGKTDDGEVKENFDFGSLAKDTLIGAGTGALVGAGFGYGSSKYGTKVNQLDKKVNAAIRETTNKVIDASKHTFSRVLKDQSGSIKFGGNNNTGTNEGGFGKNPNIVRRAVTPEQAEAILSGKGIIKEAPFHKTTPTQHVAGTKHSRNPWTSTTKRAESAEYFATHGGTRKANPIVEIDLSKINPKNILDVSTPELAAQHLKTPFTRNAASFHQEVLIKGDIPQEAIVGFVNR